MLDECIELARVEGGKLAGLKRDRLAKNIGRMPDGPVTVKVTRKKPTRSERQNAYYWPSSCR